jgi:hypothetical protein
MYNYLLAISCVQILCTIICLQYRVCKYYVQVSACNYYVQSRMYNHVCTITYVQSNMYKHVCTITYVQILRTTIHMSANMIYSMYIFLSCRLNARPCARGDGWQPAAALSTTMMPYSLYSKSGCHGSGVVRCLTWGDPRGDPLGGSIGGVPGGDRSVTRTGVLKIGVLAFAE